MELAIPLISPAVQIIGDNLKINSVTESSTTSRKHSRTLEYYQSIYTHCKQRFNIPDGIETFKETLYQYIENYINNYLFGDYNISEVRHNLYESLVHYSHLNTQDFNSQTLETYFQELNFNIIQYCEENYSVEQKFSFSFESETEEEKGKRKQKLRTTLNTPKTTAKHLQTPEQGTSFKLPLSITPFPVLLAQPQTPSSPLICPIQQQEPILTSPNLIDYLAENQSEETESEQETEDSENKKEMAFTYIAKIPEFTEENSETILKAGDANGWNAFTDNNTSITLRNWFQNIKQEPSKSVMTYLRKFNKLLRRICQLETNEYYSNAQILDQFIAELKDKLIKKVCPHAPEDLATAIQQTKNYKMAIEEANHTKLNFCHTALSEDRAAAQQQNPSYIPTIILPARIAENANLSDIFPFKFEANESPFLLSNAAANEQKAITAMYIEAEVPTCGTFNKCSEKAPAFEFEPEEEKPIIETFMALGSTSNWANEIEQQYFSTNNSLETKEPGHLVKRSEKWDGMPCLTCGEQLPDECNWIDVAFRGEVCDQTCQYAFLISEKVTRGTFFDATYNSVLNKLYHYPYNAKMIFNLAIALINRATQENVRQMKESEYIAYTFEIAGYNYKDKVEVYHQIASYTYSTKEA
ncbi:hypothetical protein G9A89_008849 [Geosiphon pyriformis]|nr:hypothetical protein G9A89_008849 [Geosiphon pyriformis]